MACRNHQNGFPDLVFQLGSKVSVRQLNTESRHHQNELIARNRFGSLTPLPVIVNSTLRVTLNKLIIA